MAMFDETPIIELGEKPIAGDLPCGADPAEDEAYISVQAEIAKLDRIEAGEPNWHLIEQLAGDILRSKAKEVDIASILGVTLFKRHQYAGLAAAIKLITGLVNNFWDGCFPERPRRRKARIEWLTERFTESGWFRDQPPKSEEFDAVDLVATRIAELEAALIAKMPDDPPDFAKFVRAVKELAGRRPQAAAAPAAGGETGAAGPAAGAGGATFTAGEVSDTSSAVNAILGAVAFLRKADPADPLPYALVRVVKWARISLPTSDAAKYQIQPPEASVVDTLTHQLAQGMWDNLLKNAEAAFRSNDPLWLDLQRHVCTAMAQLGPNYERARQAVMILTGGLVKRLGGGIYELKFRNGTPLCGPETKMWIESEVCPPQGNDTGALAGGDGKLSETSQRARKLAGEGKLKEALQQLREGLLASSQRRDRFLWRLTMAKLCHDSQRLQLALPLLEECHEEIDRYHIDEWEPSLALQVAQTLYRCRKATVNSEKEPTPQALQGVRDAFAWLCQLDPLVALAAEPSST